MSCLEPYTSLPWHRWHPQTGLLERATRSIPSMVIDWEEVREHRGAMLTDIRCYWHGYPETIKTEQWTVDAPTARLAKGGRG
jgi:hypothetical protein